MQCGNERRSLHMFPVRRLVGAPLGERAQECSILSTIHSPVLHFVISDCCNEKGTTISGSTKPPSAGVGCEVRGTLSCSLPARPRGSCRGSGRWLGVCLLVFRCTVCVRRMLSARVKHELVFRTLLHAPSFLLQY